jgi:hypothetical protein
VVGLHVCLLEQVLIRNAVGRPRHRDFELATIIELLQGKIERGERHAVTIHSATACATAGVARADISAIL